MEKVHREHLLTAAPALQEDGKQMAGSKWAKRVFHALSVEVLEHCLRLL